MGKHTLDDDAQLAKQEKKRIKKERKQALQIDDITPPSTDVTSTATPVPEQVNGTSNKERRKKDKKSHTNAIRFQDITPPSTDVTSTSTPMPEDKEGEFKYNQQATLTSLPQRAVDDFHTSQSVVVTDPLSPSPNLRPLLSFEQLPTELYAQFSSIFKSFGAPTPIQSSAWPYLLAGRDVVGISQTGSGKTLAFGLPLVARLSSLKKSKSIRAAIIAPTRELALQVFNQISILCATTGYLKAACIYGGTNKDAQRSELKHANIIVATPGRLKDFLSDNTVSLSKVRYLVLDEGDRMLDAGFSEDIKHIISHCPTSAKRQTAMFTATWPKSIRDLAATFMTAPIKITIGQDLNTSSVPDSLRANPNVKQVVHVLSDHRDKQSLLLKLLQQHSKKSTRILVFALYKKEAIRLSTLLQHNRYHSTSIHGDLPQSQRLANLASFTTGATPILVATDVAARGLDIPNISLVINNTFPLTVEDYVHRIGRTGRAGSSGLAITFFTEHEKGLAGGLVNILKGAGQDVPEDLVKFGTTVKKKVHSEYGAFFREEDEDVKKSTKITFDD